MNDTLYSVDQADTLLWSPSFPEYATVIYTLKEEKQNAQKVQYRVTEIVATPLKPLTYLTSL